MDLIALKKDLRKKLDQERKALDPEVLQARSQSIFENWRARFTLKPVRYFHLFQPIRKRNEIETQFYLDYAQRKHPHVKVVVPVVSPFSDHLIHVELSDEIEMELNRWGIPEPKAPHRKVYPMQLDMVLVPMLGFDLNGHRLGFGKGFYDRFLPLLHPGCLKIGLCLEQGKVEEGLPVEDHDIPLNFIVTEELVYRFKSNSQAV